MPAKLCDGPGAEQLARAGWWRSRACAGPPSTLIVGMATGEPAAAWSAAVAVVVDPTAKRARSSSGSTGHTETGHGGAATGSAGGAAAASAATNALRNS